MLLFDQSVARHVGSNLSKMQTLTLVNRLSSSTEMVCGLRTWPIGCIWVEAPNAWETWFISLNHVFTPAILVGVG